MAREGMAEHQEHTYAGHKGPVNTMPMMMGHGPFGNIERGGMFTLVKVRDDVAPGDYSAGMRTPPKPSLHGSAPTPSLAPRLVAAPDTTLPDTAARGEHHAALR